MAKKLITVFMALVLAAGMMAIPSAAFAAQDDVVLTTAAATTISKAGTQQSIAKANITVASQTFTGKALKPKVKVSLNGKALVSGTDYKVSYKNNTQPGKATVTISGIGKYKGKANASFNIKTKKGVAKVGSKAYYFKNTKGTKATGWVKAGSKRYWANKSGELASGWKKISGKWYYFNESTYVMKKDWQKIGSDWYYLGTDGAMVASKWVGDYYLQANGVMATNTWIGDYWVNGSGKWTETRGSSGSETVYITRTGTKFHSGGCGSLSRSKIAISRSDAIARGYTPCKNCNP